MLGDIQDRSGCDAIPSQHRLQYRAEWTEKKELQKLNNIFIFCFSRTKTSETFCSFDSYGEDAAYRATRALRVNRNLSFCCVRALIRAAAVVAPLS